MPMPWVSHLCFEMQIEGPIAWVVLQESHHVHGLWDWLWSEITTTHQENQRLAANLDKLEVVWQIVLLLVSLVEQIEDTLA